MAQRLNKKLVAALTIGGVVITTAAAILMISTLPKRDPAPAIENAEKAMAKGDYVEAAKWYQRAYQRSRSTNKDAANDCLIAMGDMLLAAGDARQALDTWGKVILNDPNNEKAQQKIVEFYFDIITKMRGTTWKNLQIEAEKLCQMNPKNSTGLHAWGLALVNQGDVKSEYLTQGEAKLIEACKGDMSNSQFTDSLARFYLEQAIKTKTSQEYDALAAKGIAVYDQLMAHLPQDPAQAALAWRRCGQFFLIKKMRDQLRLTEKRQARAATDELMAIDQQVVQGDTEALRCLSKAVELSKDSDNLIAIGEYWTVKRPEAAEKAKQEEERKQYLSKAVDFYKQAIQIDESGYESYLRLAQLYLATGELEKSLQVLEARRQRPIQREGYMGARNKWLMSAVRNQIFTVSVLQAEQLRQSTTGDSKKQIDEIIDRLQGVYNEQAAEAGQEDAGVLFMKGRLLMLKGNTTEAINTLRKADGMTTTIVPELKQHLAQLFLQVNELGAAKDAVDALLKWNPNNAAALAIQAKLLLSMGNPAQALQVADDALRIDPTNQTALLAMAGSYEAQKNWEKMREIQQRLLAIRRGQQGGKENEVTDKFQRAMIYRMQAESSDPPDSNLKSQAEILFRDILAADPLNVSALQNLIMMYVQDKTKLAQLQPLVEERLAIARSKLESLGPSTESRPADQEKEKYRQFIAGAERLAILTDPKISEEERPKRVEEVIKKGTDPLSVAIELYRLYSTLPNRGDDAIAELKKAHQIDPQQKGIVEALFATALRKKDWPMAEEFLKKAVDLKLDRSSGGNFYRGRLYAAQGEYEKAVRELKTGLGEFPTYSQGQVELGRSLIQIKQFDEAQRAFQEAIRLDPRNGAAALGLATLASLRGDDAEKNKYLDVCAQFIPEHPWVKAELLNREEIRDPLKGILRREEIRKTDPKNIDNLLRLANLYEKEGEYDKAKGAYEQARETDPKEFLVASRYATFIREQRPAEAATATKMLADLVQSIPSDQLAQKAGAQLLLAGHLAALAKTGTATAPKRTEVDEAYTTAFKLNESTEIARTISAYFMDTGQFDKAEEWARKSLALAETAKDAEQERSSRQLIIDVLLQSHAPARDADIKKELETYKAKFDDSFAVLADSEYHAGAGRLDMALDSLNKYINLHPNDPIAYVKRGDIYIRRSLWEQALNDYRTVKTLDPKGFDYEPRLRLARCLDNMGQSEYAITELVGILNEEPRHLATIQALYRLYGKVGRLRDAEKLILPLVDKDPENYNWPNMLFLIYQAGKEVDLAMKYGEEAARRCNYNEIVVDSVLKAGLQFGQYDRVLAFINNTLPADKRNTPLVLIRTAAAYVNKGQRPQAMAIYNNILDAARDNLERFANIAYDLKNTMGADVAAEMLRQRLAKDPNDRGSKLVLAMFQKDAGNSEALGSIAEELLKAIPPESKENANRLFLMRSLAVIRYQAGKWEEARTIYDQMLKLDPNHVIALNNLAYLLLEDLHDAKKALEYAKRAAEILPQDTNVLDTLGWSQIVAGEYDDGISTLRRASGIEESTAAVHYHLAEAFFRRSSTSDTTRESDLREAMNECRRAFDLLPADGSDPEKILSKITALAEKLGISLQKKPVKK